jgi:peptidoglycan hydrolase-like protein with peptidoglycan-binding domain
MLWEAFMKTVFRVLIALLAVALALVAGGPATYARTVVPTSAASRAALTVTGVPTVGTWPVLRQGADNSAVTVRSLQYLLNAHGAGLTVDGIFGARTNSAVRTFQAGHGLVVDGIVGPRSWSSLLVTVRRGSVGSAVKAFQDQMNARNIAAGGVAYLAVDGVFGAKTEAAAYYIQNRLADYWGIAVDGIVGPQTWQPLISNVLPRG